MRFLVTFPLMGLLAGLTLTACATRPQLAHGGDLQALKGQVVVAEAGPAAPTGPEAVLAKAIETRVASAIGVGGAGARYRLQVAVGTSPAPVGISTAVGPQVGVAPWRSAPNKVHFWNRRGPVRTATLAVLDLSTGEVAAWATVRSSSADADDLADRLLAALEPKKG